MLPTWPLALLIRRYADQREIPMSEMHEVLGWCSYSALRKLMSRPMVSIWSADELCCALGLHPAELYGDLWYSASCEAEAETVPLPDRRQDRTSSCQAAPA